MHITDGHPVLSRAAYMNQSFRSVEKKLQDGYTLKRESMDAKTHQRENLCDLKYKLYCIKGGFIVIVLFNMMHSVYNIKMTQVLIAMALYV
jgi:hypothetical protein